MLYIEPTNLGYQIEKTGSRCEYVVLDNKTLSESEALLLSSLLLAGIGTGKFSNNKSATNLAAKLYEAGQMIKHERIERRFV